MVKKNPAQNRFLITKTDIKRKQYNDTINFVLSIKKIYEIYLQTFHSKNLDY